MNKKVVCFDIDGTIYPGYMPLPLVRYQFRENTIDEECKDEIFGISEKYMNHEITLKEGAEEVLKRWANGLEKIRYGVVLNQTRSFLENKRKKFFDFVQPVIQLFKRKNYDIYFITATPQFIAQVCLEKYQATGFYSSKFEVENEIFTGKIETLLTERKETPVRELLKYYSEETSFCFANDEGDIEMLELLRHSFCINPTEGLEKIAVNKKKWYIFNPIADLEEIKKKVRDILSKIK